VYIDPDLAAELDVVDWQPKCDSPLIDNFLEAWAIVPVDLTRRRNDPHSYIRQRIFAVDVPFGHLYFSPYRFEQLIALIALTQNPRLCQWFSASMVTVAS
jgi:hypothetical protein